MVDLNIKIPHENFLYLFIFIASKTSVLRRQTSCHDTVSQQLGQASHLTSHMCMLQFTKLEESFKQSGLQGATQYVKELSTEKVC